MQGLADGYFVLPYTIGDYLATAKLDKVGPDNPTCKEAEENVVATTNRLLSIKGKRTVDSFHRELGKILWEDCGMARNAAGLRQALEKIPALREEYWKNVNVLGTNEEFNQCLEKAGRVADFLELAELICLDALERNESCGGHFREEHQTPEGEALRDDEAYCHAAVWEYEGPDKRPTLHKEPLTFEYVIPSQRSYK
jgi:succinate dehydrogenase / fumarate reductase flavoprotein subunit